MITLGSNLKEVRCELGISRSALARASRVGRFKISRFEEGTGSLSDLDLKELLKHLSSVAMDMSIRAKRVNKMKLQKGGTCEDYRTAE